MTLHQFEELKVWHLRQGRRHPIERTLWDLVLTVWMLGCVGALAAVLVGDGWVAVASLGALFLPGLYVGLRRWLHNKRRLRCDWIIVLR
jgi:uncharacterized BrkB/YihY/UPF0761 family membrane protein